MSHAHQLASVDAAMTFILAGNARITLVSKKTGTRFSYRIRAKQDDGAAKDALPKLWFVSVLTGSDNESDYTYLGQIWADSNLYAHGRKSKIGSNAPSARGFAWMWHRLVVSQQLPADLEIWHEGQCGRCGRALTVPESIARGIGPECAGRMGIMLMGLDPEADYGQPGEEPKPAEQPECRHTKNDGSWWEHDARGIPLARVCDKCKDKKLAGFRPDVLTDPNYWTDEPVEDQ